MARQSSADQFFEALLASNPFSRNRISDPSQMDCDVASIHAAEFQQLLELVQESLEGPIGRGVLLLGNAGIGKSHLLSRLSHWATARQACFIFLHNIQVRPDGMNRYLLKCCIHQLVEDRLERLHDTLLYRVVEAAIRKAASAEKIVRLNDDNYHEVYQQLSRRIGGEETVFDILFQFFFHVGKSVKARTPSKRADHARRAALAVRWLQGDLLDADEARQLGQKLRPEEEVCELGDDRVHTVLLNIARLAKESQRPFILCLDQADNMMPDQLSALAKSLHALIDASQNLLVVLSGVREDLIELIREGVIHAAAADRLDHTRPIELRRIKRPEARLLLHERLVAFLGEYDSVSPECKPFFQNDDLFPLGSRWFEQVEPLSLELRPRDVLTYASDRWRDIQTAIRRDGGEAWLAAWKKASPVTAGPEPAPDEIEAAIDQKVADKLGEVASARRLQPGSLPADAGNLLGLTTQLLEQCVNRGRNYSLTKVSSRSGRTADLILHNTVNNQLVETHVVFVVTGSKASAARNLGRLLNSPNTHQRILVTDKDRAPLLLGTKGEEYLAELQKLGPHGFTHVELTFEHYAQLDALLSVVGLARSGDLEIEPRPGQLLSVTPEQVIDCFHRRDHYRQHALLQRFLSEERVEPDTRPPFPQRQEFRQFVLAKLSFLMGANLIELTRGFAATQSPDCPALEACLPTAKEIVLEMHAEELVSAKPWDNDLYLTIGRKA